MSEDREPISPDFRYEVIIQTIKQLARGELLMDAEALRSDPLDVLNPKDVKILYRKVRK